MVTSINHCILLGEIGRQGVTISHATSGAACASFLLVLYEEGQDGKTYPTLIPVEIWGKRAEQASELDAGQLVVVDGKLRKRKRGEQWELIVAGFEVKPVGLPVPSLTGTN